MKLGSVEATTTFERQELLTMLLWGKPASGKTVLASTAPGKKLWLLFDPSGAASLKRSDDIIVADFTAYKPQRLEDFKQGGIIEGDLMRGIKAEGITTVVVDSLTSFGNSALYYGIYTGKANRGTFKSSIEAPGQTGYGIRTGMLLDFVTMVMRVCADCKVHCIFVAHDAEEMDDEGKLTGITFNLGGQTKNVLPAKISEIWFLSDDGKQRTIYVRSHGLWRPMRTRMFTTPDNNTRFKLSYDQDKGTGEGIATWYARWQEAAFNKIALPTG